MKITATDDKNKGRFFIQRIDLKKIIDFNLNVPASIFLPILFESEEYTEENKDDFIEYFFLKEIDFFKKLDWIVDYNDYVEYSIEELCDIIEKLYAELEDLSNKFNSMPIEERKRNMDLLIECDKKKHMIQSILYIGRIKSGDISLDLPDIYGRKSK